jgi:polyhydroxyalkanoate synthase
VSRTEQETFIEQLKKGAHLLKEIQSVEVGTSPRELVFQQDKLRLFRYHSDKPGIPVLIVYSLVNRPYITDLQPDRSFIKALQAEGLEVFLVDWGYPDAADRYTNLDDYLNDQLDRCVERVSQLTHKSHVNLIGICQGGTLALCYSALHPQNVSSLTLLVTPVDFHTADNRLTPWLKEIQLETIIENNGNFPGEALAFLFRSLKPFQLNRKKYVDLVNSLDNREKIENFLRMERWINDSPDLAGEAFLEFNRDFFIKNGLMTGQLEINQQKVNTAAIKCPILNIFARQDHLVPPASSKALSQIVPQENYTELPVSGGHIGLFVGSQSLEIVPKEIGNWLKREI